MASVTDHFQADRIKSGGSVFIAPMGDSSPAYGAVENTERSALFETSAGNLLLNSHKLNETPPPWPHCASKAMNGRINERFQIRPRGSIDPNRQTPGLGPRTNERPGVAAK